MKIIRYLESSLSQAISNTAAKDILVALDPAVAEPASENAAIWQQPFSMPEVIVN